MMQIVHLPAQLSETDLVALNRRLRGREVRLDWSLVRGVEAGQLAVLFADLRLDEHIEHIGEATISIDLMPVVLQAFALQEERLAQEAISTNGPMRGSSPALWQPEEEVSEGEQTIIAPAVSVKRLEVMPSKVAMRDELQAMVLRDLLGPVGGEAEELDEQLVHDRYLIGTLAPNDLHTFPEELEELGDAEEGAEEGTADTGVTQARTLNPSSIGMSFCVSLDATSLLVTARWGQYNREASQVLRGNKDRPKPIWKRYQRGGEPHHLPLKDGRIEPWRPEEEEQPEVFVKGTIRRSETNWTVTLFLVNGQKTPKQLRDRAWLFQPELIVEAAERTPIFRQRAIPMHHATDESRAMAMLYRKHVSFAVGHGVSVHAETLHDDPTGAVRLSTCFAPTYDIAQTQAPTREEIPALAGLELDMKELALMDTSEFPGRLEPLVTAYRSWIEEQELRINDPAADLQAYEGIARQALAQCRRTLERIRAGINMLKNNDDAARAFKFMNRAMWLQRIHTLHAEERRRGGTKTLHDFNAPEYHSWRTFQLAFILLNISSLSDLHHHERSGDPNALADLLWFPTGGGKTEAYLGLTAFALAIRRLQGTVAGHSGMDGVTVIMRYTLRLLTLQQFQRAASLMCACEIIRQGESATWGTTPFRLGLWVGQKSTPNTTEQSAKAREEAGGFYSGGGIGSPRQLTHCPWCGSTIEAGKHIEVESVKKGRGRTLIYCGDPYGQCNFSKLKAPKEGLPVVVVDEEIYRLLPALLISTVDKFAQMPWKGETQMLFGQVNKYCTRHGFRSPDMDDSDNHRAIAGFPAARSLAHDPLRPPDLIIQDELHLISGPLGTLVGLYETAIDHLCTWEVEGRRVRPKVIAATATIRRAADQVRALFLRKVEIFPPQGLDIEDNFFARQRPPSEETPGRRYLGICASGRRIRGALIRVYLAQLAAAQVLYDKYGAEADPWMTLVGYFNSISELGGMRRLVDDDVANRLWKMNERGLAQRRKPGVEELTSRKSSAAIPDVLSKLELTFGASGGPRPIDVLLATNMISVGVDVKRLGLMVVAGQPKTTAEYIQATSRVGRSFPGLVCTVYNWARPRDLSHYEQFEHYHATFYQQVEALSVTPFAPRALDRGLAALLTSFIRLSGHEFNKNDTAGNVTEDTAYFEEAIHAILERAEEVAIDPETIERVRADLERLKAYWVKRASQLARLGYKKQNDGITLNLLNEPEQGKWELFTCLNSLRDVEPTVNLIFDERGMGDTDATGKALEKVTINEDT